MWNKYIPHRWTVNAQVSLHICTVSPEPLLLHSIWKSLGCIRHRATLLVSGCACNKLHNAKAPSFSLHGWYAWQSDPDFWLLLKTKWRTLSTNNISSPEPKAHRWAYSIGNQPSSIRQHFQTTSPLKPWSRFFPYFAYSNYRQGERIILFLFQSDKNSGCKGNLYLPST